MTLVISEADCERVLDWKVCIDALEHGFLEAAEGRAMSDARTDRHLAVTKADIAKRMGLSVHALGGELEAARARVPVEYPGYVEPKSVDWPLSYLFKTMVGTIKSTGIMALRVNSEVIGFDEEGHGRREAKIPFGPGFKYTGLVFLFSVVTGELLAIMQDGFLQRSRVTGTAAVGTKYLARDDATTLGMIGTGAMAEAHVFCSQIARPGLTKVQVYSPTSSHREKFALELSATAGIEVQAVDSPEKAFKGADIAIEATNAHAPIIDAAWLEPGVHYVWTSPGATSAGCYDRADLVVSTWRGWPADGTARIHDYTLPADSELIPQFVAGGTLWDRMVGPELGEIISGRVPGRSAQSDVTLHANVSSSLQFAAVGSVILDRCTAEGIGTELDTDLFLQWRHP